MFGWGIELGIDLGTCNTTIYRKGTGIVLTEPSVIAFSYRSGKVLAAGQQAKLMADQRAEEVRVVRPLVSGAVADHDATVEMLRCFLIAATGKRLIMPKVVATIITSFTQVEERALVSAVREAGARRLWLIDQCLAGAIGAAMPVNEPQHRMVVDIGAGVTKVGIISLGSLVAGRLLRFGGDDLDEAIRRFVKRKYGLTITPGTSENMKIRVGAVTPELAQETVAVDGQQLYGGLFRSLSVTLDGIPELLNRAIRPVMGEIKWVLEELPPEQRADIRATGITLTGGTSLLRGLPQLMTQHLGVPVTPGRNPSSAVAVGIGTVLEDLTKLSPEGKRYATVPAG